MEMNHIIEPHASMCSSILPQLNQQLSSFAPPDLLELTCEMHPESNFFLLRIKIRYVKIHTTHSDSMHFQVQISSSKTNMGNKIN